VRRRDLIAVLGTTAVLWPGSASAQQKPKPVIGFLGVADPGGFAASVASFHKGLREAGYIEGENLAVEYRWADGHNERLPALAADLVGRKVDVLFTSGGVLAALAAR
jgi:putative tryptophan/tyrosine transport system substrate-binding protein